MKAVIYFKDSVQRPSVTVENLVRIKARRELSTVIEKNYNENNFRVFTPFENESYAFEGSESTISVSGTEILYVEIF